MHCPAFACLNLALPGRASIPNRAYAALCLTLPHLAELERASPYLLTKLHPVTHRPSLLYQTQLSRAVPSLS